jgi:prepilin-type processing-associated H-X9-DG protein
MELLVVISIIALLMAILIPVLQASREQGTRAACLSNLKQLTMAWIMYADDNGERIVGGDVKTVAEIMATNKDKPWVYWPDSSYDSTVEQWQDAIKMGLLWPYLKDIKLYKCPASRNRTWEILTYTAVDSMNGSDWGLAPGKQLIKNRMQIRHPSERMVFLGEIPITPDSWAIPYNAEAWWDAPPMRHGKGSTFSFADGHSDYWKWRDKRTMETVYTGQLQYQNGNPDLHKMQIAVWGQLGYTPSK